MDQDYTSSEFYHFVGRGTADDHDKNFGTLLTILKSGWVSHHPFEKNWGNPKFTIKWDKSLIDEELIVPEITCYADIPEKSLAVHIQKYGSFGIAFNRDYLIRYGARPVMYIPLSNDDGLTPYGGSLIRNIEAKYKGFVNFCIPPLKGRSELKITVGGQPKNENDALKSIQSIISGDFLAFIKPFNSELEKQHPDNYYMEREWRKFGNLEIDLKNVPVVVVAKGYKDRLLSEYPPLKENNIEVREAPANP